MWTTPSGAVLVGRTMDWQHDMRTNIWALPAGIKRDGLVAGGLAWTAQFGSVVATAYHIEASDGLNDAGLGAHLLWLAESDYVERDPPRPSLAPSIWMQYFLDNFATVADSAHSCESDLVGDVTSRFQPSDPFQLAAPGEAAGDRAPPGPTGAPLALAAATRSAESPA
jgi:penicillin V acylase-like amidase (Ntn superfamily)